MKTISDGRNREVSVLDGLTISEVLMYLREMPSRDRDGGH